MNASDNAVERLAILDHRIDHLERLLISYRTRGFSTESLRDTLAALIKSRGTSAVMLGRDLVAQMAAPS